MMSNPPPSLQRQSFHRRQNSTPVVAFEAMKVSNSMPASPHRQTMHRRGLSFDQHQRSPIRRQHQQGIMNMTNVQQIGQQILREAQQQKTTRPGQQYIQTDLPMQPQCGVYTGSTPNTPYEQMTMDSMMHNSPNVQYAIPPYYAHEMSPMPNGYHGMGFDENNPHYFQQTHSVPQDGSFDARRMSQPDMRMQNGMRPHTPQQQIQNAQFPLTPPCTQTVQHVQYAKSQQSSPAIHSPYPVPMQRGRSLQGIIEHEESTPTPRKQRPQSMIITPSTSHSFEVADMPYPTSQQQDRPETPTPVQEPEKDDTLQFFDETGGEEAALKLDNRPAPILIPSNALSGSQSPSRPALSPRRMSISDLNLEPGVSASIEETNVTLDDIAQFIEGPDPRDNKWICKYEDCNKKFGRKENIKSHVQTHLGDRQFRCDHCNKCFVRGHDLKRHAKIHTGSKPYPCACGNSFARHDALTRHRQRGMCIGAFEGVVKKIIKRGRPRKHRPDMDDRLDKASRTRHHHDSGMDAYASSASSCTMSSWGSPGTDTMENLSIRGTSPFDDVALFGVPHGQANFDGVGFPPNMFSFTPPASPGHYSTGNKPSPSHQSHRSLSPADPLGSITNIRPSMTSTTQSQHAHLDLPLMSNTAAVQTSQHSLPSLSQTSSSPAPQAEMVAFDFSDMPQSNIMEQMQSQKASAIGMRNDFDTYLDYGSMDMMGNDGVDSFFAGL